MNSSTSFQQKQENLPFNPHRQRPENYIKWTNSLLCWLIGTFIATVIQLVQYFRYLRENSKDFASFGCFGDIVILGTLSCVCSGMMIILTCCTLAEEAGQIVQTDQESWEDLEKLAGILSCCSLILNITLGIMIFNCSFF